MNGSNKNNFIVEAIKKIDFVLFFLLACVITWTGWFMVDIIMMPLINENANFNNLIFEEGQYYLILVSLLTNLAIFGPGIAAFIVILITEGKKGASSLLKKIINWRIYFTWYAVALIIPIIVKYGSFIINDLFLGGTLDVNIELLISFSFISLFINNLLPSGGQEEIGWIGFVQLQLQERYGVIQATFIKIFMGWIWHLPLYLIFPWVSQYGQDIWLFLWIYIPIGFIYTWLFNNTDSILIPALLHASFNTVGVYALTGYTSNENVILTVIIMGLIMYIILGFLFFKYGKTLTKKSLPSLQKNIAN